MASDLPNTDEILADIGRAVTIYHDYAGLPGELTDAERTRREQAVRDIVDHWAFLRYALEQEHAPLPAVWAEAARPDVVRLAPGAADGQLAALRKAADAWGQWMEIHPELAHTSHLIAGEAFAKADHLAACVAAVDAMCGTGNLPGDWAAPYLQSLDFGDPMVTAGGGAAARAGWELTSGWDRAGRPCPHTWTVTGAQPAPAKQVFMAKAMQQTAVLAICQGCGLRVSWLLDGTWILAELRGENPLPPQWPFYTGQQNTTAKEDPN